MRTCCFRDEANLSLLSLSFSLYLLTPSSSSCSTRAHVRTADLQIVESVIVKEKPDGVVVSMGGQTALNCGVELHNAGVSVSLL